MELGASRRIAQAARDRERLDRIEKVMISYMIDPHVEENYWTDYMPEQLRDVVPYWANKNGWGRIPTDLLDEWLDHGFYRRYAPPWLRLCSAVSRCELFAGDFANPESMTTEDLAEKIYEQAVLCPEAPALFKNPVHRSLWLAELKKILDTDQSLLKKFTPADGMTANMYWLLTQRDVVPQYDYATSFLDCARHCMALHGLTSRFEEVENDLQTFIQNDERAHFLCLPLWMRNFLHKHRHGTNEQALQKLTSIRGSGASIVMADLATATAALQNILHLRPGILRFVRMLTGRVMR